MKQRLSRRSILISTAGVTILSLSGCLGDDDNDEEDENDRSDEEIAVDWASGADNIDDQGDITDMTGEDSVTVNHGETGDEGNYVSDPGILQVDSGTEITFEWVSPGHSLTEVEGEAATITDWDDHDTDEGEGYEHTVTFDDSGVALWECIPHRAQNHRGAIIVV